MNETTNETAAPDAASAETRELLDRLRANLDRRNAILEELRRGVGAAERDTILLELCGFRGMQYTEAAAAMGYTREGIAKRVRPMLQEFGLDDLTLIQRQQSKVTRPHRRAKLEDLLDRLAPSSVTVTEREREAEVLRQRLIEDMDTLHAAGMSWVELARQVGEGFSVPSIQRIRGAM